MFGSFRQSCHVLATFVFLCVRQGNIVCAFPKHNEDFRLESINFYHPAATSGSVEEELSEGCDDWTRNSCNIHINEKAPVSLFFHGGDLQYAAVQSPASPSVLLEGRHVSHLSTTDSPFVAMAECALLTRPQSNGKMNNFDNCLGIEKPHGGEHEDDHDDDEHNDDDDDDGHSSMLSNSSIQRKSQSSLSSSRVRNGDSIVFSNQKSSSFVTKNRNSFAVATRQCKRFGAEIEHKRKSCVNDPLLLRIRGGAQMSDEFAKRLVTAAIVTLLYEGTMGHIFEFLKIAMQTADPGTKYMDIISNITSKKGIGGLWDGFIPWGVIQSIFKGGIFGLAHSIAKSQLDPLAKRGVLPELVALTLAGGIAGGFQGYVLSPTLLLKTRVMTNPVFREKMSLLRTTILSLTIGFEVVKNEGMFALMKGSNIFALKRVFDWSTRYFFSDMFESMMVQYGCGQKGLLSPTEKIVASLLGGTASTIVTLPLDVIVAKSQDAKKAGVKVSAWDTFMKDYREGGLKQLYDANMQGFEVRLLHVCLTTVVMKTGSALMYNLLFGNK